MHAAMMPHVMAMMHAMTMHVVTMVHAMTVHAMMMHPAPLAHLSLRHERIGRRTFDGDRRLRGGRGKRGRSPGGACQSGHREYQLPH